jgi:hypothetical protein
VGGAGGAGTQGQMSTGARAGGRRPAAAGSGHGGPAARRLAQRRDAERAGGTLTQGKLQAWVAVAMRADSRAAQNKHKRPGELTQAGWLANTEGAGDAVGGARVCGSAGAGAAWARPEVCASRNAQARVWTLLAREA